MYDEHVIESTQTTIKICMFIHTYVHKYFRRTRPYFLHTWNWSGIYILTYIYVKLLYIYMGMLVCVCKCRNAWDFFIVEFYTNSGTLSFSYLSLSFSLSSLSLVQLISCTLSVLRISPFYHKVFKILFKCPCRLNWTGTLPLKLPRIEMYQKMCNRILWNKLRYFLF